MSGTAAPGNQLLAAGVMAGIVLALGVGAVPTAAFAGGPTPDSRLADPSPSPAPSAEGLAEAVLRDLGMTLTEFNAAGELGRQAMQALDSLQVLPGYEGLSIGNGKIQVRGTGSALQARVDELNKTGGGTFVLVAPPALEASVPAPAPDAPSAPPQSKVAPTAEPAPGRQVAVSAAQLFQAYLRDVGTADLQAVVSEAGQFVIRTGGVAAAQSASEGAAAAGTAHQSGAASPGKISPSEFVAKYANVVLDGAAPLKPEADVPGGVGYRSDQGYTCSTGFSAFDPAGLPAVLTAGHCAEDGTATTVDLLLGGVPSGRLGTFQFSQFGGPGNSPVLDPTTPTGPDYTAVTDPGNVGTDIAVIGAIRQDLDPLPATGTHGNPSQPGPDVKIIGTAAPVPGMPVCRSGWRTGWSCGHVSAVGIFLVGGPTYVDDPADPGHNDIRAFNGFLSYDVQSAGGDSGGPWISGNFAVGTHSAGESGGAVNIAVAATLQDSLKVLPGYQLELFLNKPAITAPASGAAYQPGQVISGQVPAAPASAVAAGSTVRVTLQGKDPFEVPVDSAGKWSFTAPQGTETLRFTAETVNGFSRSGANSFEYASAAAPPAPPASPAPTEPPASPAPSTPAPSEPALTDPALTDPAPADPPPAQPAETPAVVPPPATSPATAAPPADLANTGGSGDPASGGLAYTGSAGLLPAAAAAAGALAVGIVLTVLVRRRKRRASR